MKDNLKKPLFIGKFQPPHLGHILTAKKLIAEYGCLIIGVTEGRPQMISRRNVLDIFESVLGRENISYVQIDGAVDEGTAIFDFEFDVVCSGNHEVLTRLREKGYDTKYVERSDDYYFTGTSIRDKFVESAHSSKSNPLLHRFSIVDTHWLKPIEKVYESHFANLESKLIADGVMKKPVIVDEVTGAVLDGSHRYAFLVKHGYRKAPAVLVNYSDESIFVGNSLAHRFQHDEKKWLSKDLVRAGALTGKLLEPRTTRHFFPFRKIDIPTQLSDLHKEIEISINHLISRSSIEEQVVANEKYIEEINIELNYLNDYIKEEEEVRVYLWSQIESMKKALRSS